MTGPARTADQRQRQRTGFRHRVADYADARPGYPAAAIEYVLGADNREVLDLGAGTGKLTKALLRHRGRDGRPLSVTAVEPLPEMLAELRAALPGCTALNGSAERIPLPDRSMDAIVVGHAFHWFDRDAALAEISRVLRPGGTVGLLWNLRDDSVDWVGRLTALIALGAEDSTGFAATVPYPGTTTLTHPVRRLFGHRQRITITRLLALVRSRGYVIALDDDSRAELIARVTGLVLTHPELVGLDEFDLPYQTEVWRADKIG